MGAATEAAATEAALEERQRKRIWKRVRLSTLASFSFFCYTLSKMNPDDRDAMWERTVAWAENITLSATTAHCVDLITPSCIITSLVDTVYAIFGNENILKGLFGALACKLGAKFFRRRIEKRQKEEEEDQVKAAAVKGNKKSKKTN